MCAKVTTNSPWRKYWKCSCLSCLSHLSSCTALSDLLRKRVSLPELHTDPDLILLDTGATLFCTRYLLLALWLLVLHLTLFLAFGKQETQALSQIKWDIWVEKWLKEEQKTIICRWVLSFAFQELGSCSYLIRWWRHNRCAVTLDSSAQNTSSLLLDWEKGSTKEVLTPHSPSLGKSRL